MLSERKQTQKSSHCVIPLKHQAKLDLCGYVTIMITLGNPELTGYKGA